MTVGSVVYLCWYDFQKRTEHVCKGEVVDNEAWNGTKWEHFVNVRFQPPSLSGTIEHHFKEEKLSMTADNVPHDDCYLVCGKKTRFFEHDIAGKLSKGEKLNASDAWKTVQQFKQEHWDYKHGHLAVEALGEYYQMWREAIAAKRGITPDADATGVVAEKAEAKPQPTEQVRPSAKAQGTVVKKKKEEVVQLSLFD